MFESLRKSMDPLNALPPCFYDHGSWPPRRSSGSNVIPRGDRPVSPWIDKLLHPLFHTESIPNIDVTVVFYDTSNHAENSACADGRTLHSPHAPHTLAARFERWRSSCRRRTPARG